MQFDSNCCHEGADGECQADLITCNDQVQLAFDSCNWPPLPLWSRAGNVNSGVLGVFARRMEWFIFHLLLVTGNFKRKSWPEFKRDSNSG